MGSYSYDMSRMVFEVATLGYIQTAAQSIVLDYQIFIRNLRYVQIEDTFTKIQYTIQVPIFWLSMTLQDCIHSDLISYRSSFFLPLEC